MITSHKFNLPSKNHYHLYWPQVNVKPRQVADLSDAGKHMGCIWICGHCLGVKKDGQGPQVDLINHIEQKQNH